MNSIKSKPSKPVPTKRPNQAPAPKVPNWGITPNAPKPIPVQPPNKGLEPKPRKK